MIRLSNNIFGFRSRKKRGASWYIEHLIRLTFALTLSLLLISGGGEHAEDQLRLIPFFFTLLVLHGLSVFINYNPECQNNRLKVHRLPLTFIPFLLWLLFSANFLSNVPWRAQIDLIIYFEAWIILWIACNHILRLRDLRMALSLIVLTFLVHLYLGYDQFFHGRSISELGVPKKIRGLFSESTSFVFLMSLFFAVTIPLVRLRFWKVSVRCALATLLFLCFFALIFAHNLQGYWMLLIALVSGCFFTPNKRSKQIIFVMAISVLAGLSYACLSVWIIAFSDYFSSAFRIGADLYGLSILWSSFLLFINHGLWGVGLAAYGDQLFQIKSAAFPLAVDHPQNFYLLSLSELGVIGFFALMAPILSLSRKTWQQFKQTPKWTLFEDHRRVPTVRFYLSACGAFILSFALAGSFYSVAEKPFFLCMFALALCILCFSQTEMWLSLRKSNQLRAVYAGFTLLFASFFAYDAYRVFQSQVFLELASQKMEVSLFSDEAFGDTDLKELVKIVDIALAHNRENLDAWLLKSTILNARYNYNPIRYEGDPSAMLEASQFALDRQKKHWKVWMRHGISLAVNGELDSAEQSLLHALKLAPQNFDTNFYMAFFCYQLIQDYDRSQRYLDKALELQPRNKEAWELSRKLSL